MEKKCSTLSPHRKLGITVVNTASKEVVLLWCLFAAGRLVCQRNYLITYVSLRGLRFHLRDGDRVPSTLIPILTPGDPAAN